MNNLLRQPTPTRPRVSVCVPCLNTRPYLQERFETIFSQTLEDWELIVVDSYSTDGSWEYIAELAARESRMAIYQTPPGLYSAWNSCITSACGEYIYVATSDDTMEPDCLERMVAALDANPDCGLCQCALLIIDQDGVPLPVDQQWGQYTLGKYDQNLILRKNKRIAPHDGIVHPALFTIYTSVTQLLIRREVFDRVGMFDGRWGSISDFEWEMRASLVESCIYIPEKLASWRVHPSQATGDVHTLENTLKMIEMARAAFERAKGCDESFLSKININDFLYFLERDVVALVFHEVKANKMISIPLIQALLVRPRVAKDFIVDRFRGNWWGRWASTSRYRRLDQLLRRYNIPSPIYE